MNTESTSSPCPMAMTSPGKRLLAMFLVLTLAVTACTTNPYTGEKEASKTGLGAGIGALAGGGAGYYMDKQDNELRAQLQNTGVSVTRNGDSIILNMPGNITFATGSSNITADFYPVLNSVALVVNKYEKTYIDIIGHTDSKGSKEYNQRLSEERAQSVARFLETRAVIPERVMVDGMGEADPIASNDTREGRAKNRRLEIKLRPVT